MSANALVLWARLDHASNLIASRRILGDQLHDVMPRSLTVLDDLDDCVVALDAIKSAPVVVRFVRLNFGEQHNGAAALTNDMCEIAARWDKLRCMHGRLFTCADKRHN